MSLIEIIGLWLLTKMKGREVNELQWGGSDCFAQGHLKDSQCLEVPSLLSLLCFPLQSEMTLMLSSQAVFTFFLMRAFQSTHQTHSEQWERCLNPHLSLLTSYLPTHNSLSSLFSFHFDLFPPLPAFSFLFLLLILLYLYVFSSFTSLVTFLSFFGDREAEWERESEKVKLIKAWKLSSVWWRPAWIWLCRVKHHPFHTNYFIHPPPCLFMTSFTVQSPYSMSYSKYPQRRTMPTLNCDLFTLDLSWASGFWCVLGRTPGCKYPGVLLEGELIRIKFSLFLF